MSYVGNSTSIAQLMESSGVQFGTSGARGLVSAMTDKICYAYMTGFLQHMRATGQFPAGGKVAIAGDLRQSSPRIMAACAKAVKDQGGMPVNCGAIPSPAVAGFGIEKKIPSIMITGSHIPEDRNGIKFNSPRGEIMKSDETAIRGQQVTIPDGLFNDNGLFASAKDAAMSDPDRSAYDHFIKRYTGFFPADALAGLTVAVYEHSTVARDALKDILQRLGAKVLPLGFSDVFVSVDTEAIRPEDVVLAREYAKTHDFDAIVSADGDGDRPLLGDHTGQWLRGDVAGILCARYLNADVIVTPVSSNSAVDKCGWFKEVRRTRIGSPYVIEEMDNAVAEKRGTVVGYEANGGFLIATPIQKEGRSLAPLPTRDCVIVALTIIHNAKSANKKIAELLTELPPRYTASDRVKNFPTALSQQRIKSFLTADNKANTATVESVFGALCGKMQSIDTTDGLRIQFNNSEVVHLRPSGNAPEFRCYNEASTQARATELNSACMAILESWK